MARKQLASRAEQRLAELVDDPGPTQLGKRVVRRPGGDDGAVRQRLAGPVVVGDDDVEPARPRLGDLLDRRHAAVDGQDQPTALVGETREGLALEAVALLEAARQVPLDLGTELA